MLQEWGAREQVSDLFTAQPLGELLGCAGKRDLEADRGATERLVKHESHGGRRDVTRARGSLRLLVQIQQVGLHLPIGNGLRRAVVVPGELGDRSQVGALCVRGESSKDHLVCHLFAELRHGGTSWAAQGHGLLGA